MNADFIRSGNVNEDLNFEYGEETGVYGGCGALLRNVFWYFGGWSLNNIRQVKSSKICSIFICFQVSKTVGFKLERQTDLNFDFYRGACSTFTEPDPKILLCFHYSSDKKCHT